MIRVPVIVPNSNWTPEVTAKAATIISPIEVVAKPGRFTIASNSNPADSETIVFGTPISLTYTFKTTPVNPNDVQIGGTALATLENLVAKILATTTTVNAWIESTDAIIEHKLAGSGQDINVTSTWALPTPPITTSYLGNNGAIDFSGQIISISQNGATPVSITLPAYAIGDGVTNIASTIDTWPGLSIGATAGVFDRIVITSNALTAQETLEITAIGGSGTPLFNVGDFSVGRSIGHPASDISGSDLVIRMYHPADPVFFRNDNRPLIDLADNDWRIYREFIALRDGYDINDGSSILTSDALARFKANLTVEKDLHVYGDIIMHGGSTIEQNVSVLMVADKTITLNSGETGVGVSGSGISGLIVDRGTLTDVTFVYDENGGDAVWRIDGPILGTTNGNKSLTVGNSTTGGTLVEQEQVTIGDGVNTFGTYNAVAGVIDTAMTSALAALPNGGMIFIKRGNYDVTSNINIYTDNIAIEGEGAATKLTFFLPGWGIRVGNPSGGVAINNVMLHKLRFAANSAAMTNPLVRLSYGTQLTASTSLTNTYSYRVDAFTAGDNFTNVGLPATPTVGEIYTVTSTAVPTTWTATTTALTPVYSRRCIVEKCWFEGVSGSTTNLDVGFNEYHGHVLANNISSTYLTNLP